MGRFSLVGLKVKHSRWLLRSHGLQSRVIELHNYGCNIHFWAPPSSSPSSSFCSSNRSTASTTMNDVKADNPSRIAKSDHSEQFDPCHSSPSSSNSKPALLFLHGFGGDGTIAWESQLAEFSKHFSLYLPDLVFFGNSTITDNLNRMQTTHMEHDGSQIKEQHKQTVRYSENFQAECMFEAMKIMGVREAMVVGHSYGGFVAYRMAHLYPSFVTKIVIVSSGIMMNPHTNDPLLHKFGATRIHDMLVPPTLPLFIKSLRFVFNDFLPSWLPSFLYKDLYQGLSGDREGWLQLVDDIIVGKEDAPPLPTIGQRTLILWGEEDKIFDVTLAYQLKEFLGAKAKVSTIKSVGHVPHMVKPKEFNALLLPFLMASKDNNENVLL